MTDWEFHLVYRIVEGEASREALECPWTITGPEELKPGTELAFSGTMPDRYGAFNVAQLVNMDCARAMEHRDLVATLIRIDMDAPAKLPPPKIDNYEPPPSIAREIIKDFNHLQRMTADSSIEIRASVDTLGHLIKMLDHE